MLLCPALLINLLRISLGFVMIIHLRRLALFPNQSSFVQTKASTEKLAKLVSDCLFDGLVFLIMDAVNEVNNNDPTSAHFAELIAACMRLFGIVLLTTPNYGVLQL